jgi:hypothetical protein
MTWWPNRLTAPATLATGLSVQTSRATTPAELASPTS